MHFCIGSLTPGRCGNREKGRAMLKGLMQAMGRVRSVHFWYCPLLISAQPAPEPLHDLMRFTPYCKSHNVSMWLVDQDHVQWHGAHSGTSVCLSA